MVFVDLERDGLLEYPEMLEFRPKAGDLIVWHARSIHKIDGPSSQARRPPPARPATSSASRRW